MLYLLTKSFITIYFYFIFYFYIKLWGDDIISSPKALYGDKLFLHQLFLFYFFIFLLSYGVTILISEKVLKLDCNKG